MPDPLARGAYSPDEEMEGDVDAEDVEAATVTARLQMQIHPIDLLTEQCVEQIRHVIYQQGEDGEFVDLFISPAVIMTDDWPLNAAEFVRRVCENEETKCCNPVSCVPVSGTGTIRFDIKLDTTSTTSKSGWLNVRILDSTLPLALFTRKENNDIALEAKLDQIMEAVHQVIMELFPNSPIASLQGARQLWQSTTGNNNNNNNPSERPTSGMAGGDELQRALKRVEALQSQGVNSRDIRNEMERVRTIRRTNRQTKKFTSHHPPYMPTTQQQQQLKEDSEEKSTQGRVVQVLDESNDKFSAIPRASPKTRGGLRPQKHDCGETAKNCCCQTEQQSYHQTVDMERLGPPGSPLLRLYFD